MYVVQLRNCFPIYRSLSKRGLSSLAQKRCSLFDAEKTRQKNDISRIEKIDIKVKAGKDSSTLIMNKNISTPFNCAMHMSELFMERSVLALLNGKEAWDMHRPLKEDCTLEFIHFKSDNPYPANLAFWRTGSFMLGYILEKAFKDEFAVRLCSFPPPDISSGSFLYDIDLGEKLSSWEPSEEELASLSRVVGRLSYEDYNFERLTISESLAQEMFADNELKASQIPSIASKSNGQVIIYRVKDHIDITRGPLIASTRQLSHWFRISAFHALGKSDRYGCNLHRVQGIAIPSQFHMHKWTFDYLAERAKAINQAQASNFAK